VCEVLLYASHSDPQLRGNTALVIGRFVRAGLGEGHGSWDGWLASLNPATACCMLILFAFISMSISIAAWTFDTCKYFLLVY